LNAYFIRIAPAHHKTLERAVPTIEDFEARLFITRTDYISLMPTTGNFPIVRDKR
jgi:hypothetical protein